jgi:hypothetical protein
MKCSWIFRAIPAGALIEQHLKPSAYPDHPFPVFFPIERNHEGLY